MRVAYLTLDEVHQDLAMRLAENAGMIRYPLSPRDPPPDGQFDAVFYDWDYLLPEQKQAIFSQLCSGRSSFPVGLHSYHLEEKVAEALRQNGVAVCHRLELELFRGLQGPAD